MISAVGGSDRTVAEEGKRGDRTGEGRDRIPPTAPRRADRGCGPSTTAPGRDRRGSCTQRNRLEVWRDPVDRVLIDLLTTGHPVRLQVRASRSACVNDTCPVDGRPPVSAGRCRGPSVDAAVSRTLDPAATRGR